METKKTSKTEELDRLGNPKRGSLELPNGCIIYFSEDFISSGKISGEFVSRAGDIIGFSDVEELSVLIRRWNLTEEEWKSKNAFRNEENDRRGKLSAEDFDAIGGYLPEIL